MRWLTLLCLLAFLCDTLSAQYVYTIKADSVKITNCDSAELILENHTQNIPGFLFNTGNGRTIFKRGAQRINDSMFVIGADTMKLPASWVQGGNAFGAPGVLGTRDNQPLDLITNAQLRASLTADGNLNIGSATIAQNGNLSGTDAILFNHFTPRFHNYDPNSPFISRLEDILYNYTGRLHTTGSVRFAGLAQDNALAQVIVADSSGNLYTRSAGSLALDNPIRSSLAVSGTIRSKKIIISPDDWADYVFDSSYRLPRLAEVESYIRHEHHLPGIPSAAAVQKDSLDVGAGQAALLKKIEELTLYTIDQDKKLADQQKEIEKQRDQIESQREEFEAMKARLEKLEKLSVYKN